MILRPRNVRTTAWTSKRIAPQRYIVIVIDVDVDVDVVIAANRCEFGMRTYQASIIGWLFLAHCVAPYVGSNADTDIPKPAERTRTLRCPFGPHATFVEAPWDVRPRLLDP